MRYLIYQRVSTDEQDIKTQTDHCINYLKCQSNYTTHELYTDPDTSSRLPIEKRPGLLTLLEDIKKDDMVVVIKLDRLSRDIVEMVSICRKIRSNGADIFSLAEGMVADWMLGFFGSLAQKEKEDISMRTRQKLQAMKARGERVGYIPYGKKLVKNILRTNENRDVRIMLEDNPEEILVLKRMHSLRTEGLSYRDLAKKLNELHLLNRGRPWNHASAHRIYQRFLECSQRS